MLWSILKHFISAISGEIRRGRKILPASARNLRVKIGAGRSKRGENKKQPGILLSEAGQVQGSRDPVQADSDAGARARVRDH